MRKNTSYFYFELNKKGIQNFQSNGFKVETNEDLLKINFLDHFNEPLSFKFNNAMFDFNIDRHGAYPLFFKIDNNSTFFSSHCSLLPKNETTPMDLESIQRFINQGFLESEQTLWYGINKASAGTLYSIDTKSNPFKVSRLNRKEISSTLKPSLDSVLNSLRSSLKKIITQGSCPIFALSAGSDSRLLLALLDEADRRSLTFYTKKNPAIVNGKDSEIEVTRSLAKYMNFKHIVIENPEIYSAFLVPDFSNSKVISGLFGGEILGGISPGRLIKQQIDTRFSWDWVHKLLNSSRTTVYGKGDYGWASPYSMTYYTESPFLSNDFLDTLVSFVPDQFENYSFYSKIWQLKDFRMLAEFPFISPILEVSKNLKTATGIDPKSISIPFDLEMAPQEPITSYLQSAVNTLKEISTSQYSNINFYYTQSFSKDPYLLL